MVQNKRSAEQPIDFAWKPESTQHPWVWAWQTWREGLRIGGKMKPLNNSAEYAPTFYAFRGIEGSIVQGFIW